MLKLNPNSNLILIQLAYIGLIYQFNLTTHIILLGQRHQQLKSPQHNLQLTPETTQSTRYTRSSRPLIILSNQYKFSI